MSESNAGRPKAGFEFVESNTSFRYVTKNFGQRPTQLALAIYQRHVEGMTVRQLAEDYNEPKSNIARIIKNVAEWHEERDARRLAEIRARGR